MNKLTNIEDQQKVMLQRINRIESKDSINTSTPIRKQATEPEILPSLEFLRTNADIQNEVASRIKHLESRSTVSHAGNNKQSLKSGRYRAADTQVNYYVSWPQEFVYVGPNRKTVNYDDLSSDQFTLGYLRIAQRQTPEIKNNMIEHLMKLLQSTLDYNFMTSRGAHAVILQEIERGTLTWNDTDNIEKTRALYTNKVASAANDTHRNNEIKRVVCSHFNTGKCNQHSDHQKDNLLFRHICVYCYRTVKKAYSHPETVCHRKLKNNNTD